MSSDCGPAVTGTMLRDLVVCERRAWQDVHSGVALRDKVGSFVQMLWAQGVRHETEVLGRLEGGTADLRDVGRDRRLAATAAAMSDPAVEHVLGGEIAHDGLLGRPDVLSRLEGRWVAGDVKSGSAFMPDGVRCREEYLAQIGLYAAILEETGTGRGDLAFVIGPDGERAMFDLDVSWSPGVTARALVAGLIGRARRILQGTDETLGAASAQCGLCHWRTLCAGEMKVADDLTLIAEVGRRTRGIIMPVAATRTRLAEVDVGEVRREDGRPGLPGVGAARLARFRDRARLQLMEGGAPYARQPLGLARAAVEWHLDIESDPTRGGIVYLHGIWERRLSADGTEASRFVHFFADGEDGERDAFSATWRFLASDPAAMVYYYSPFERVSYAALQRRHPEVCTAEDVSAFFASARVIDLYSDVVRPHTEWPLSSYGIKPLAKSLGFSWAAEDASGASSIAWYDEYVRTGDPALRDRIVDYNRSDCIASAVVLDGLIALPVGAPAWPGAAAGESRAAPPEAGFGSDAVHPPCGSEAWRREGEELDRFFRDLQARSATVGGVRS